MFDPSTEIIPANSDNTSSALEGKPVASESPDKAKKTDSKEVHRDTRDLLADNTEFLNGSEKISALERQKILEQAREWESKGDLDLLRASGLSFDQIKQNPLDRHIRLAALFLKRQATPGQLDLKVDYQNNQQAEFDLELGDLLPANVLKVDILDQNGKIVFADAERKFKAGKPVYVTSPPENEAFAKTGFTIRIKESQSSTAIKDPRKGEQSFRNGMEEETYMLNNFRATLVKEKARAEAAKEGKTIRTDKQFFDEKVPETIKKTDPESWKDFQSGKPFDSKFLDNFVKDLVKQLGLAFPAFSKFFDSFSKAKPFDPSAPAGPAREDKAPAAKDLPNGPPEKISNVADAKVVYTARFYIGNTSFRGPEVAGGNLACAQVASTILKEAGVIDKVILGVEGVEAECLKKGWTKSKGPGEGGDVVIWGRTPTTLVDGVARPGHGHIGIMTSRDFTVNNSSNQKMPIETRLDYNSPRGVYFLKPPHRSANS